VIFVQTDPDIETVSKGTYAHSLGRAGAVCCWLKDGQTVHREEQLFSRPDDFFDWVRSRRSKDRQTWIFSHGLGYTLTLLDFWDHIDGRELNWVFGVLEDPPTIILTRWGRNLVRWVDTKNYWRVPLEDLPGSLPVDRGAGTPAGLSPCERGDRIFAKVRAVEQMTCRMIAMLSDTRMCGLQATASALSFACWRTSFLTAPLPLHDRPEVSQLERDAFVGGLLDVRRRGQVSHPIVVTDANSLYPWAMRHVTHPWRLIEYHERGTLHDLQSALLGLWCVADVLLAPDPTRLRVPNPSLAGRGRPLGGEVLCGGELRVAYDAGLVRDVGRMAMYEPGLRFSEFVSNLYPEKVRAILEGRRLDALFWKMLLNSLHGKFAQKKRRWIRDDKIICIDRWGSWFEQDPDTGLPRRCRSVAGLGEVLHEGGQNRQSFPAVAASITESARRRMQALAALVGRDELIYVDTDCLHVGDAGFRRLDRSGNIHPTELGLMKVVTQGDDGYYWGPKHYRVGEYWVSNVVQCSAAALGDGLYLQQTKQGLLKTFDTGILDQVLVRDTTVRVDHGPGAYRPSG
jgi:hypothetical protein